MSRTRISQSRLLTDDDGELGNRGCEARVSHPSLPKYHRVVSGTSTDRSPRSRLRRRDGRTLSSPIMGDVCSVLRVIEEQLQTDENSDIIRRKCSTARGVTADREITSADRSCEKNFLADEPILRDLLRGIPTEHDLCEVACTINRLVFFYVIIRWINLELSWALAGGGSYTA